MNLGGTSLTEGYFPAASTSGVSCPVSYKMARSDQCCTHRLETVAKSTLRDPTTMNCAIVSAVLLALAVLSTAMPIDSSRQPPCWIFSISTRQYVKLSADGKVTADGHLGDSAIHVTTIPETTPQQLTIEAAKSTTENVCFLTFDREDGMFKGGKPLNGNELFEKVPVSESVYALRVVNPIQESSGSGMGELEPEVAVDYFLGFSSETFEAGIYESADLMETKFVFFPNHE